MNGIAKNLRGYKSLESILAEYSDGDENGWDYEFSFLSDEHGEQIEALTADIAANGILEPIVLGSDGRIWDGHHRLLVARNLGLEILPIMAAETQA